MDHEEMAGRFVDWARQRYGVFRREGDTVWLGGDELNQEQIANVVEQWTGVEGVTITRGDAYAVAQYATHMLED